MKDLVHTQAKEEHTRIQYSACQVVSVHKTYKYARVQILAALFFSFLLIARPSSSKTWPSSRQRSSPPSHFHSLSLSLLPLSLFAGQIVCLAFSSAGNAIKLCHHLLQEWISPRWVLSRMARVLRRNRCVLVFLDVSLVSAVWALSYGSLGLVQNYRAIDPVTHLDKHACRSVVRVPKGAKTDHCGRTQTEFDL